MLRLDDLGMPTDTHETYSKLIRSPFGMVLCAGPTGSGKTTTLYATLSEVDDRTRNVMTIEDPVEYVFPTINQIQTNEQAGLTFASGLRSRSCARTPTSSWSARSATSRPPASPCSPL